MFRWTFPALVSGLIALITFLPLGWVSGFVVPDDVKTIAPDLKFRGTVWDGSLTGLPIFGSANFSVAPLSRRGSVQSGQGQNYLAAQMSPTAIRDVVMRLDLGDLPLTDGRLQGLRGLLRTDIVELNISDQSCTSARGTVWTDVLQRNGGQIQWTGPELRGPLSCEEGALIANLSGRDAQQSIEALIRLQPDGIYRADVTVKTSRVEADAVLPLFGFSRSGQNFVLTEQARWR
jgi:hypothetical protein